MTVIDGTGAASPFSTWTNAKQPVAVATAGGARPSDGGKNAAPSPAPVPSASLIVAAEILAADIVRALDSNHNGTLSKSEIAALSPFAAAASDSLDTNHDGQVSVGELADAMLQGFSTFLV
jgi:hypothetical protein